jgi:hypothetical protein
MDMTHAPFNLILPERTFYFIIRLSQCQFWKNGAVRIAGDQTYDKRKSNHAIFTLMNIEFNGKIWFWRGPAPWYFVTVPAKLSRDLKAIVGFVTYGWGMIPVYVQIGKTRWTTSLFPKDGYYIVPIKASVRKAENLEEGDTVAVRLEVR